MAGEPEVEVLHADAACIVIVKPAGLLSVPGRGEHLRDCAAARVRARFGDALIVHRLDMATSGLLLFARGPAAQRALSVAFANREVHKRYVAVVDGLLQQDVGEIDSPLLADWPNRPMQKVDVVHGKASLTRYRVLARDPAERSSRVELEPVTGRAHQLRVHLQSIGHTILGDTLYATADVQARAPRLQLHASELRFVHPVSAGALHFQSAPPF